MSPYLFSNRSCGLSSGWETPHGYEVDQKRDSPGRHVDNRAEDTYFDGAVDDLRVYNRVLTPEEIAWLGGSTTAYDKPFLD